MAAAVRGRPAALLAGALAVLALTLVQGGGVARSAGTVTLAVVGDVLLDRGVARAAAREGWPWVFREVREDLGAADLAFANLECPVTERRETLQKKVSFRADRVALEAAREAGLDILCLANNHSTDCGREGLVDTMGALHEAGLLWCGAGATEAEAEQATVVEVGGVRIAFLAFSDWLPEGIFPNAAQPTIALASEPTVRREVARARARAEVVVVAFHWGVEFTSEPTDRQRALARAAVEAGAGLVIGHHPHVLQGIEVATSGADRRPALVAYSLGNFVFDQYRDGAADSAILTCTLSRAGVESAAVIPIRVERGRPTHACPEDAQRIRGMLDDLSRQLGALLDENGRVSAR